MTTRIVPALFSSTVLTLPALAACGDDAGSGQSDVPDVPTDTVADVPADTDTVTEVADSATSVDTADVAADVPVALVDETFRLSTTTGGVDVPYAGAPVRAIFPDGKRFEAATDADGEVTIAGIDWSRGPLTVTLAPAGGHLGGGIVGFGQHDLDPLRDEHGVVVLHVGDVVGDTPVGATISGKAVGMASTQHSLYVSVDLPGHEVWQHAGANWHLDGIATGVPFHLIATEWANGPDIGPTRIDQTFFGWTTLTSEGVSGDQTLGLDFGQSLSSTKVSGSYIGPVGDATSLDETGVGVVVVFERNAGASTALLGATTKSSRVTGGGVEYELEYAQPEWAEDPVTLYQVARGDERSAVTKAGWPVADATLEAFYVPAVLAAPSTMPQAADEPLAWSGVAPEARTSVNVYVGPNTARRLVAQYYLPLGATGMTFPSLPGDVDLFTLHAVTSIGVQVVACEPGATAQDWCKRIAWSRIGVVTGP